MGVGDVLTSRLSALAFILSLVTESSPGLLIRSQRGLERMQQCRVTKWLEQTLRCPLFEEPRAYAFVSLGGNEDGRNILSAEPEFLLQIRPSHAGHDHIENQALGLVDAIGTEKLFCRGESAHRIPELIYQV